MIHTSLAELQRAIQAAWSVWTADPVDQSAWSPENPGRGQCATTALVVQDLLGGELLLAEVSFADGRRQGVHFSNRFAGGLALDLTRDQFRDGEVIGDPRPVPRPADVTRGRLPGNYHLLAARVRRELAGAGDPDRPVTAKAVCRTPAGEVLLCRNHRGDWELPGGRPEIGEPFTDSVRREVGEETGLDVSAERLIAVAPLEVLPGAWIDVVAYDCALPAGADPDHIAVSEEHRAVAFVHPAEISPGELPGPYRDLIAAVDIAAA